MGNIAKLQKAIYSNLDSLRELYQQAEGLKGIIDKVDDAGIKKELTDNYDKVIKTFDEHLDTTDIMIKALKRVIND